MAEGNVIAGTCDGGGCEMGMNYDICCIGSESIAITYFYVERVDAC